MNNLFSTRFGLNIRRDGDWHANADPAYAALDVVRFNGKTWAAAVTPEENGAPGIDPAWADWGWEMSTQSWLLTRATASFENDAAKWVNNNDGTGLFTPKAAMVARLFVQGGGGGAGGAYCTDGLVCGDPGGAGLLKIGKALLSAGVALPVTIGAAGAGAAAQAVTQYAAFNGTAGGTSSFAALLSAKGGVAGSGQGFAAKTYYAGYAWKKYGAESGLTYQGEALPSAWVESDPSSGLPTTAHGGGGGSTLFGMGGVPAWVSVYSETAKAGANGGGYGSGGSGGVAHSAPANGGNGAAGCIYIERIA